MAIIEVKVPDIGDFKDIPVIEVLVKPGNAVKAEDPLVTLESDKATMDVPSPIAGVVKSIAVKLGDRVSEGSVLMTLEAEAASTAPAPAAAPLTPALSPQAGRGSEAAPLTPALSPQAGRGSEAGAPAVSRLRERGRG